MSLESDAGQPLQFETARPSIAKSGPIPTQAVTCVACHNTIDDQYYDVNAQTVCDRCREQLAHHAETPKGVGVFGKALLYGFCAAILGAILYYAVVAITNLEIGLVAIAIGYMVGYAIKMATESRGGRRFQILAVLLTYWAVGLAYTPLAFKGMAEEREQKASTNASATLPAEAPPPTTLAATESPDDTRPAGPADFAVAIGLLLMLSFALPVLAAVGSMPGGLISLAIIAFGMQQAWRMTSAPALVITGPYRIARSVAS